MSRYTWARVLALYLICPQVGSAETTLFWGESQGVYRADSDGATPQSVGPAFAPEGLAVSTQRLVWSQIEPRVPITPTGVLQQSAPVGAPSQLLQGQLVHPAGVALASGQVVWSDLDENGIWSLDLDGQSAARQVLQPAPSLSLIRDLQWYEPDRALYFVYVNPLIDGLYPGQIGRVSLAGGEAEGFVAGLSDPRALDISAQLHWLVWADYLSDGTGTITGYDLQTGQRKELTRQQGEIAGVALDEQTGDLYWTNKTQGAIFRRSAAGQVERLWSDLSNPGPLALMVVPEPGSSCLFMLGLISGFVSIGRVRSIRSKPKQS